jgi:hypothetical protein
MTTPRWRDAQTGSGSALAATSPEGGAARAVYDQVAASDVPTALASDSPGAALAAWMRDLVEFGATKR